MSGQSNGGISANAARMNARLRSRISEFVLSPVFGRICVPHMKHRVLVLFDTNMTTARSYQLLSQPCGLPSDCVGCTFCRGTEHLHLHGGRSRDGQKRHLWVFHTNAGLMDKCATTSSFKILYPLHSDRFYIFFPTPCNCCRKISCLDDVMLSNCKTKLYDIKVK